MKSNDIDWNKYFERDYKNLKEVLDMPEWLRKMYLPQTLRWCYWSLGNLSGNFINFPSDDHRKYFEELKEYSEKYKISLE